MAVRTAISANAEDLDRYEEICGFARTDQLPVTYPHQYVHALVMALMTAPSFPFAPMGAVHLRDAITQHRPIGRAESLDLTVEFAARLPHPKGTLVEFRSRANVDAEVVWEETMTVLFRGRDGAPEQSPSPLDGITAPDGVVQWRLGTDLGRRFARISGDYNPIHLHPLAAKPFGFPRNIAHGMWSMARCVAGLQNKLPDAFTVQVEFHKPVILPTTVVFGVASESPLTFGLRAADKPLTHLVGLVTS